MKTLLILLINLCGFALVSIAYAVPVPGCGDLRNGYGPWDYTNLRHFEERLPIVEVAHFNSDVESLKRSMTPGGDVIGDLDYVLRTFPNHHRALYSMLKYRVKNPKRTRERFYSADCYFKRAIAFKYNDGIVWMLYGIYNHKLKKYNDALDNYKMSEKLLTRPQELYYNMGLLYYDIKNYEESVKYAKKAYALGYQLQALKDKLSSIGKW